MVEVLLAFAITMMITASLPLFGTLIHTNHQIETAINLESGLAQLSNDLVTARQIETGSSLIYRDQDNQENRIFLDAGRLVRSPGFVIYCSNLANLEFFTSNNIVYVQFDFHAKTRIYAITSDYEQ